jgi:DNA-binding protein H-NS
LSKINIKNLSVTELLSLRRDIDAALQSKKSELHRQLTQIDGEPPRRKNSRLRGSKVAAKYRNPRTGETWSGRGGIARWLAAEIKAGKKKDSFLVRKK